MPSVQDKSLEGDDPLEPHSSPPNSFSAMSMHIYPFPNALMPAQQPVRAKRRQVKNACTHCQKACKKCDDARPCLRCVKYGYFEECVDSKRKERKKGVKRGPYKKRDGRGMSFRFSLYFVRNLSWHPPGINITFATVSQPGLPVPNSVPPIQGSYIPLGYSTLYGQYPPMVAKPGEAQTTYTAPYYMVPAGPPHADVTSDTENPAYTAHTFYHTAGLAPMPYAAPYPTFRPDGPSSHNEYPVYSDPVHQKPSSPASSGKRKPKEKNLDRTRNVD